ncbi:leucyl aminopeptidase family protein [Sphingomonas sp. AP4-R1]|uniref:leucyl aminopeptidase family protein n=1 Tax=Sphingomonas sp. AP4-R1 TaxID=2735134 RepID=UPI0014938A07|nr:leucyl aminopeptidase family protein [Sphingomonas sp. AP4-R1]QJU56613.1 leucyl aminopeptidase family protein [Sphingomonas sp. AP4-R1]
MTDFASLLVADRGQPATILYKVAKSGFDAWMAGLPQRARTAVAAARFKAEPGSLVILQGDKVDEWNAAVGVSEEGGPWDLAAAAQRLPEGLYRLAAKEEPGEAALGWLLAQHRFDAYRSAPKPEPVRTLLTSDAAMIPEAIRLATAVARVRDMVDTPSADMGPAELQAAAEALARANGAACRTIRGDALLEGFPMIHAVGRAAARHREPRLIELEWGDPAHPRIAIVGKGVCFDSGGLDIKPPSGMLLMKKDMGGAAHALALAGLVMESRLPVFLHLLIPAVENAISADAFRPGDVLKSRKGLHVEIGNTDAEGRLILGDALTLACEGEEKARTALVIDFATLTGAARVALGPDLPALFANDDALADALLAGGIAARDPLWRLPLWAPYHDMLKSDVADINNAGAGGFAGSITAALFLERFVVKGVPWAHLDTFAWNPAAKPGRPKGGEALGLRAAWAMLKARFSPDR